MICYRSANFFETACVILKPYKGICYDVVRHHIKTAENGGREDEEKENRHCIRT